MGCEINDVVYDDLSTATLTAMISDMTRGYWYETGDEDEVGTPIRISHKRFDAGLFIVEIPERLRYFKVQVQEVTHTPGRGLIEVPL
ncbi:hypothetical protein [Mycobacteroides abscessus]|uniref:hypothetical protein n=1 Tax=Mycobacteroides abscessus TaxID=36809 RepID=UPI000C26A9C6|nr:hypothetical protein [Mycobacteroides abscessus]